MNGNTESIINITDFVKNVIEYNVKEEHIQLFLWASTLLGHLLFNLFLLIIC